MKEKMISGRVSEVVTTYGNKMNEYSINEWKAPIDNLFFGLISYARNKNSRSFTLTYEYILSLAGVSAANENYFINQLLDDFSSDFGKFAKELIKDEDSNEIIETKLISVFNKITIKNADREVYFEFAENEFTDEFMKDKKNEFTKFNLYEYILLSNKDSKLLFRLLSQFQSTGRLSISLDKMKFLSGKEKTSTSKFISVIEKSVSEINESNNMINNLSLNKLKNGRSITDLEFTFDKCKYNDENNRKIDFYNSQVVLISENMTKLLKVPNSIIFDEYLSLDKHAFKRKIHGSFISTKGKRELIECKDSYDKYMKLIKEAL